jgi:hypothetical protein
MLNICRLNKILNQNLCKDKIVDIVVEMMNKDKEMLEEIIKLIVINNQNNSLKEYKMNRIIKDWENKEEMKIIQMSKIMMNKKQVKIMKFHKLNKLKDLFQMFKISLIKMNLNKMNLLD